MGAACWPTGHRTSCVGSSRATRSRTSSCTSRARPSRPRKRKRRQWRHEHRDPAGAPRRIFGAHAAHLRRCDLRSSLTHQRMRSLRCSAAPSIWATWPPNLSPRSPAMALRAPEPVVDAVPPVRKGITRRQALAAAVATGVGVGAVRLLGGAMQNITRSKTASGTDWVSPFGRESARVMQLLRRTSFGYTQAQLDSALSDGYGKTVDRLLNTPPAEPPALAAATTPGGRFAVSDLQRWWID